MHTRQEERLKIAISEASRMRSLDVLINDDSLFGFLAKQRQGGVGFSGLARALYKAKVLPRQYSPSSLRQAYYKARRSRGLAAAVPASIARIARSPKPTPAPAPPAIHTPVPTVTAAPMSPEEHALMQMAETPETVFMPDMPPAGIQTMANASGSPPPGRSKKISLTIM